MTRKELSGHFRTQDPVSDLMYPVEQVRHLVDESTQEAQAVLQETHVEVVASEKEPTGQEMEQEPVEVRKVPGGQDKHFERVESQVAQVPGHFLQELLTRM